MARMSALADEAARALLDDAEERLDRRPRDRAPRRYTPAPRELATNGHAETVLMEATEDATCS